MRRDAWSWRSVGLVAVLAACALGLVLAPLAQSANWTVNTQADSDDGSCGSPCSLRDAIKYSSAGDVITLPPGHYTLTSSLGDLVVSHALTLNGAGARTTTIDGAGVTRVLTVNGAGTISVNGVTITGGNGAAVSGVNSGTGGGIYVNSTGSPTLELTDSTVTGNTSGNSGGGIDSNGSLVITRSTIDHNTVTGGTGLGGGIDSFAAPGSVTISDSTISDNSATAGGGGIQDDDPSSLTLRGVTIAGNTVTGPTGSGGGVSTPNNLHADNTIIAGNSAHTNTNCNDTSGVTNDHNLSDSSDCGFDEPVATPQLGPLADNGGPTDTRALAATSPAVDAGDPATCSATDQRGVTRPQGAACDIGAYEYQAPAAASSPPPTTTTTTPSTTTLPPPTFGQTVNVVPSGVVLVKVPGSTRFIAIAQGQQLPLGTIIDVTHGSVVLTSARTPSGGTETATFFGGQFRIGQSRGGAKGARAAAATPPETVLTLTGRLPACPRRAASRRKPSRRSAAFTARRKVHQRHLWGDGHGNFQTRGHYSAATVRGTRWLTEDTCAGTLTRVARGVVTVRDFVRHRTVRVPAGHSYLARAPRR